MKYVNWHENNEELQGQICDSNQAYYIWGAGVAGVHFYQCVSEEPIRIIGFLDSRKTGICEGLPIFEPEQVQGDLETKVIIATLDYVEEIEAYLKALGKVEYRDYYYSNDFLEYYMMYKHRKLYSHHLNIHVTDKCSYRCKACSVYIPYIKNPRHMPLEMVIDGIKNYFSVVDYVMELHILGGEPMLYPSLKEIVTFIGENFRDRICEFAIATNGTILPDRELCELCNKYQVFFTISDYSHSDRFCKNTNISGVVDRLEQAGVSYRLGTKSQWFEFEINDENMVNDEIARKRYDECFFRNRVLKGNIMYYCHHEAGAAWAGKMREEDASSIDLCSVKKLQFMLFDLGKKEQRCLEYCYRCNGYERVNHSFIPAAEQLK